ncbi:hypothetical protein [Arthrobacter ramosus]|uniref:Uncharacterized protein n=1 Tax=Arthrobacter ramosus TaxID=1672 RepID=A0ABV5Y5V5_ARTRM
MDNRAEVREFLIARCVQVSPVQVGLPAGTRRVDGSRRSEVAANGLVFTQVPAVSGNTIRVTAGESPTVVDSPDPRPFEVEVVSFARAVRMVSASGAAELGHIGVLGDVGPGSTGGICEPECPFDDCLEPDPFRFDHRGPDGGGVAAFPPGG